MQKPKDFEKSKRKHKLTSHRRSATIHDFWRLVDKHSITSLWAYGTHANNATSEEDVFYNVDPIRQFPQYREEIESHFGIPTNSIPEARLRAELEYIFDSPSTKFRHREVGITEIDIYFECFGFGVEYDGMYYHQNKKKADLAKNLAAEKQGILIFRLREVNPNAECFLIDKNRDVVCDPQGLLIAIKSLIINIKKQVSLPEAIHQRIDAYLHRVGFANIRGYEAYSPIAPFDELRKVVKALGITTYEDSIRQDISYFHQINEINKRLPKNAPLKIDREYWYEWKGYGHFFGGKTTVKYLADRSTYASFAEIVYLIKRYNVKTLTALNAQREEFAVAHRIALHSSLNMHFNNNPLWINWRTFYNDFITAPQTAYAQAINDCVDFILSENNLSQIEILELLERIEP